MPKKYYSVKYGREGPKIYETWNDCQKNVSGFSGAIFKSFENLTLAKKFIAQTEKIEIIKATSLTTNPTTNPTESNIIMDIEDTIHFYQNDAHKVNLVNLDSIVVYTDGSCKDQGTDRAVAGAGIYFPTLNISASCSVPGKQTNNRGELWAVIGALMILLNLEKYQSITRTKNIPVEIHLDSTYVINNINSNNKINLDLWEKLHDLLKKIHVQWVKVLAHSGDPGNEYADKLAKATAFSRPK